MTFKRGALPRSPGVVVPRLSDHIAFDAFSAAVEQLPWAGRTAVDRQSKVTNGFPMYDNDRIGDCTCAGAGHVVGIQTAYSGKVPGGALFTNAVIDGLYSEVTQPPYDPATGANDNGAELWQVAQTMITTGITDTEGRTHKWAGYCDVSDFDSLARLKDILNAFGAVYLGANVGDAEENAFSAGQPWTLPKAGQNVGPGGIDHCVVLSYSAVNDPGATDNETLITWGAEQKFNEAWGMTNIGEAIAVFSQDMLDAAGDSPIGQAMQAIVAELQGLPESSVNPSEPTGAKLGVSVPPKCPFCGLAFGSCHHSQGVNPV
jgi:hypothetical protein